MFKIGDKVITTSNPTVIGYITSILEEGYYIGDGGEDEISSFYYLGEFVHFYGAKVEIVHDFPDLTVKGLKCVISDCPPSYVGKDIFRIKGYELSSSFYVTADDIKVCTETKFKVDDIVELKYPESSHLKYGRVINVESLEVRRVKFIDEKIFDIHISNLVSEEK